MNEEKPKRTVGKPFQKGDSRINRKGRPKTFDALRSLAQDIAHEIGIKKDGSAVVSPIDGKPMTVIQAILMQWAMSPEFNKQKAFVEYAYGKPVDEDDEVVKQKATGLEDIPEDEINAELARLAQKGQAKSG